MGIGVHCGKLTEGTIRGHEYMDFSVSGSTVNPVAHMCGQAGPFEIIVSDTVTQKVE